MPICRLPLPSSPLPEPQARVRISRYLVTRRVPPRAANDNRRSGGLVRVWPWVAAVAVAPPLTAALFLTRLF